MGGSSPKIKQGKKQLWSYQSADRIQRAAYIAALHGKTKADYIDQIVQERIDADWRAAIAPEVDSAVKERLQKIMAGAL